MDETQAFERQVEHELRGMVGPIPRFDAIEIAETAVAARSGRLRGPRVLEALGLAAAAAVVLAVGISLVGWLTPDEVGPVRIDEKGTYATVSEAVADAVDGDVIRIAEGVYEEQVRVESAIEIRGEGDGAVVFHVTSEGPAFRLLEADATISGIDFLWLTPEDEDAVRRPVIDIDGGRLVLEDLVAISDAPEAFTFIRIDDTAEGSVIRGNRATGSIIANRGAQARIEDNVLLAADLDAPPAGIEASRADTFLQIHGNELNFVSTVQGGGAEVVGNRIHGAGPGIEVTYSGDGAVGLGGSCGVFSFGRSPLSLADNEIYDNGTGICGSVEVLGGEIHDNDVGVYVDRIVDRPTITGAVIRDNDVGVEVEPSAAVILTDVAFCGNGVDIEADETATVEQSGTAECPA